MNRKKYLEGDFKPNSILQNWIWNLQIYHYYGKEKCNSKGEEETKIGTEISFDWPIVKKKK